MGIYCVVFHVIIEKTVVLAIMENWEINKNLANKQTGMKNYDMFRKVLCATKEYFNSVFGVECLNKIFFYVDNEIDNPKAPISIPMENKFVRIVLDIGPNACEAQVSYQFSHELTHVVFWDYFGLNKKRATEIEETICTAASLIVLKNMYPDDFNRYEQYTANLNNLGYRSGVPLAKKICYDMEKIKYMIKNFPKELLYEDHS